MVTILSQRTTNDVNGSSAMAIKALYLYSCKQQNGRLFLSPSRETQKAPFSIGPCCCSDSPLGRHINSLFFFLTPSRETQKAPFSVGPCCCSDSPLGRLITLIVLRLLAAQPGTTAEWPDMQTALFCMYEASAPPTTCVLILSWKATPNA
eukprot:6163690-Pleurochrysis_carterae.AAC.7